MYLVYESGDVPPPDPSTEHFISFPKIGSDTPVLQGNRGINNPPMSKALLDFIILLADLL